MLLFGTSCPGHSAYKFFITVTHHLAWQHHDNSVGTEHCAKLSADHSLIQGGEYLVRVEDRLQGLLLCHGELYVEGCCILLQVLDPLGPWEHRQGE